MARVLVVIPALNAAATLPALLGKIRRLYPHLDLLVVDDGSQDDSRRAAESYGAKTIVHARNRGKGAALMSGFAHATTNEYDVVITLDADLQHDPQEIQKFLAEYGDDFTIIIGRRERGSTMPFPRKLSNSLSSFVVSLFSGAPIADSQSGFRLIPTRVLKEIALSGSHYELEPELLIRAARQGYRIKSVEVSTIYNESSSSLHAWQDTLRFLIMLAKSLFW